MLAALATAGLAAVPAHAALPTGTIEKVSPEGPSTNPALDDSGTVVAYLQSAAGHVMVGPTRIVPDAGAKEIAISGDGGVVAFSTARALLGGDGNGLSDIYAVNRDGGGLRLVSPAAGGVASFSPAVNGNGGTIAYSAGSVAPGSPREIWLRDGGNAPAKLDPPAGAPCDCIHPSITNDGNSVAFEATDAGIVVWQRGSGPTRVPAAGNGASWPSISGNGRAVAYQLQNLIIVFNRESHASTVVPDDGLYPSMSGNGNVVAFQASKPMDGDANNKHDVAAYELSSGVTTKVSARPDGTTPSGGSYQPSINGDGGRVAFESDAGDLVGGDGNGVTDIFLRIPADGAVAPVCCSNEPPVDDTPDIPGKYWLVGSDGGIFSFGGLGVEPAFFGSTGDIRLNRPIVGMAAHPSGNGYWFVASDGGVFAFGGSKFFGSTGNIRLNRPIVGMASTPSGNGYWMVATDGGIFSFGDATFMGSTGDIKLNKPIIAMGARPQGDGYWLVASDGGVFAFGRAPFKGSTGAIKLNQPIVGMSPTRLGNGYWFVSVDGGVFNFGDAGFFGSMGATRLNRPIVGMAGSR